MELLIDLLACLEPKLWTKNPFYPKIRKLQKQHESPNGGLSG